MYPGVGIVITEQRGEDSRPRDQKKKEPQPKCTVPVWYCDETEYHIHTVCQGMNVFWHMFKKQRDQSFKP